MPQGNLGYKSGKSKFAIHDIIRELRYPPRTKQDVIDLEDYNDPRPALEFLIIFTMGCKRDVPSAGDIWEDKLNRFLWKLRQNGWTTRKINGMVLSILNKLNLGVEIYRCMGGKYQR